MKHRKTQETGQRKFLRKGGKRRQTDKKVGREAENPVMYSSQLSGKKERKL